MDIENTITEEFPSMTFHVQIDNNFIMKEEKPYKQAGFNVVRMRVEELEGANNSKKTLTTLKMK